MRERTGIMKSEPLNFAGDVDWQPAAARSRDAFRAAGTAATMVTWRTAGGAHAPGPLGFGRELVILVGGRRIQAVPADAA